jgi:small-conductance mechanosensitive channel
VTEPTLWLAVAAGVGGALLHLAIERASRRVPVWIAGRRGPTTTPSAALRHGFVLAGTALQMMLWAWLAWILSERFAALHGVRSAIAMLLDMSFRMPIVMLDQRTYTLLDFLALPLLLAALWIAVSLAVALLRRRVLAPAGVSSGLQEAIGVLLRYSLVALGAIVVLQARGIDLRSLAIFASVLGLGIGFGLQNIANNFVSGLLINLELPIRPGDFVRIGEFLGTVQRVGARSTEIRTPDDVAILVPNARFLETEIVNWNHGSPLSRVHLPVAVDSGSNVTLVRDALLEAVQGHPGVQRDPRPRVELKRFAHSALDFEVLVWTREPRAQFTLASDLNFRIAESLQRHGIPFPDRDVQVRSPELARLLDAVTRLVLPEAAPPTSNVAAPGPAQAAEAAPFDAVAWSDVELDALAARMRAQDGVAIRDRRHLWTPYARCFIGRDAVAWLMEREELTRSEAIDVGQRLVERGDLHHVLDEHGFRDGPYFYRFRADEAPR